MRKTGFIAIVGRPNVGKSTLLNAILGEKVSIISNKPQTTRNLVTGIHNVGDCQYVFLDTPGMLKPRNLLGDYMARTADQTMREADAVILVADVNKPISVAEENVIAYLKESGAGSILAINKIDLSTRERLAGTIAAYAELHEFDAVVPISAKKSKNIDILLEECKNFLTESEWYFPEDMLTDQPERQIAAEIIREKLLRTLNQEVPHGIAVVIEEFSDEEKLISVRAEIFCERQSHKKIIIGKGGAALKLAGTYAREELERFFDKKVYLDLWVKVKENWRENAGMVRNFGYRDE